MNAFYSFWLHVNSKTLFFSLSFRIKISHLFNIPWLLLIWKSWYYDSNDINSISHSFLKIKEQTRKYPTLLLTYAIAAKYYIATLQEVKATSSKTFSHHKSAARLQLNQKLDLSKLRLSGFFQKKIGSWSIYKSRVYRKQWLSTVMEEKLQVGTFIPLSKLQLRKGGS